MEDTEVKPQYSVYGKIEFMQLVGITESELQAILADHTNIDKLIELMKSRWKFRIGNRYETH